jgi:dihydroorotase-like cyclic amidohydrolase
MDPYDFVLTGGILVTGEGMRRADVAVQGERIAAVAEGLPLGEARLVIDVAGRYVFPGIIDVHVHPVYLDDVEQSSRVAAYGGIQSALNTDIGEEPAESGRMLEDASQAPARLGLRGIFDAQPGAGIPA